MAISTNPKPTIYHNLYETYSVDQISQGFLSINIYLQIIAQLPQNVVLNDFGTVGLTFGAY